jgi:hypothetical protein
VCGLELKPVPQRKKEKRKERKDKKVEVSERSVRHTSLDENKVR